MKPQTIALFGEAEKGDFRIPYLYQSVPELLDRLGHPPRDSLGIFYAIQALMYEYNLLFVRVHEEGFSHEDYLTGLNILKRQTITPIISAFCLPGVGDASIIRAIVPICAIYHSTIIMNESDLYDYLTEAE